MRISTTCSKATARRLEYAGYLKAWRDRGPAALVGVVVDTYNRPRPPVRPLLTKFGVFIRNLLDHFEA